MVKKLFFITLLILTTNQLIFAQNIDARVFEPEKVEASKIYKNHSDINMNVLMRDRRSSSDLFRQQIFSVIELHFKESFPETTVKKINNTREVIPSEPNKILVIIDVIEYFVAKKRNKWIGKTSFDLKVFDYREENIKEFNKQIIITETKPDRESLNSAKKALTGSFSTAVKNSKIFVENSIRGEKEFTFVD